MTRILQQQLESYLWGAATLLRGTIDAGDYKQFIFPLLFYKRICDVFDEETEAALRESGGDKTFAAYQENHRFQVPSEAHWHEVRQTSNNVGQALQSDMRAIETANPEKLYGIFGDAQWTNKDRLSDTMLRDLVEHFSSLEVAVIPFDGEEPEDPVLPYGLPPISADPPLHTWTRRLLLPWFSHRRVESYEQLTRLVCRSLIKQF